MDVERFMIVAVNSHEHIVGLVSELAPDVGRDPRLSAYDELGSHVDVKDLMSELTF